jgi:hypothetical protein
MSGSADAEKLWHIYREYLQLFDTLYMQSWRVRNQKGFRGVSSTGQGVQGPNAYPRHAPPTEEERLHYRQIVDALKHNFLTSKGEDHLSVV